MARAEWAGVEGQGDVGPFVAWPACALVGLTLLAAGLGTAASDAESAGCLPDSVQVAGAVPTGAGLDAEQAANARTIVSTAVARRMPSRAAVIAVATAMQESDLHDLPYGDRDSLGLFQQRPSGGWGERATIMDPTLATEAFLDRLRQVPNWPVLPLTVAAQDVQRSAYPDAYARWEAPATAIVGGLLSRPAPSGPEPSAVDTPGLLVLGDQMLSGLSAGAPHSFQGGSVAIDVRQRMTLHQGLAVVRKLGGALPGTVILSLDRKFPNKPASSAAGKRTVVALLKAFGPDRTVYWLTPTDGALAAAVATAVQGLSNVQLVDTSEALGAHPDWVDNGVLNSVGAAGIAASLTGALGLESSTVSSTPGCFGPYAGYDSVPLPACGFAEQRPNPRSCADALRWALAQTDAAPVWHRRCLHFVARAYGWAASGTTSAATFWAAAAGRHPDDPNPPAGALVFWATGGPDGHVALSAGDGVVLSNDIAGPGTVAAVGIDQLTARWGAHYLGWAPPDFPHGN